MRLSPSGVLSALMVTILFRTLKLAVSSGSGNDEPIPVYYINLARRPDREAHMRSEFQRHGLRPPHFEIKRFEAIDGLTHVFTEDQKKIFATFDATVGKTSPHNTALLKANSLSHVGVWKLVQESGVPFAIVFQDDVQLANGFAKGVREVLENNPSDALITWLGINYFASGRVSRSAPLHASVYDANQFSKVLPGTENKIGIARKNLISTNSLAYIVTRRGAETLLQHFDHDVGWTHHTDHAMVDFLDERGLSYISRTILATTHDDGVLGSDIFTGETQQERDVKSAHVAMLEALKLARLPLEQAVSAATQSASNPNDDASKEPWMHGLKLVCEEMQCLFSDCRGPLITYAILSWGTDGDETCSLDSQNDSCQDDDTKSVVDDIGVRRDRSRKKLLMQVAAADVTPQVAAEAIPAWWVLEAWSEGKHEFPTVPRPRFAVGDVVKVNFAEGTTTDYHQWETSEVLAVGYHDPSWDEGLVATYVVKHSDGRLLTVAIDDPRRIHKG